MDKGMEVEKRGSVNCEPSINYGLQLVLLSIKLQLTVLY